MAQFEMMIRQLPADDILRRLPAIMESKQRLRIGLHVHCHDIMVNALGRLRALCVPVDAQEVPPSLAAMIFADAWSIVDQVDLVRQAMAAMPDSESPATTAFYEHAAQARLMRNAMDHISQRIPTIANRSGASEALFGSLTFVRCDEEQFDSFVPGQDLQCELVTLACGTVPGFDAGALPASTAHEIDRPVSNLRLSAGGAALALDLTCAHLTEILQALSRSVRTSIDAEITQLAVRTGSSEAELRASAPVIVGTSTHFITSLRPAANADGLE